MTSGLMRQKRGSYNCTRCGLPKKGHTCLSLSSPLSPSSRRSLFNQPTQNPNLVQNHVNRNVTDSIQNRGFVENHVNRNVIENRDSIRNHGFVENHVNRNVIENRDSIRNHGFVENHVNRNVIENRDSIRNHGFVENHVNRNVIKNRNLVENRINRNGIETRDFVGNHVNRDVIENRDLVENHINRNVIENRDFVGNHVNRDVIENRDLVENRINRNGIETRNFVGNHVNRDVIENRDLVENHVNRNGIETRDFCEHYEVVENGYEKGDLMEVGLYEVLKRIGPGDLMRAAMVCRKWRDVTRKIWKAVEEVRVRVPKSVGIHLMLQKCVGVVRLFLTVESDVDATMLASIAFSCPDLESLEIFTASTSVNRITGDELARFVADKRSLTSLKMEGCSYLGGFALTSTSLLTLWLSDLHCLSKMDFNCPNLKEISLGFSCQVNDNTDLTTMVNGLGMGCPKLQNMHIASLRLNNAVVLALAAAHLRWLQMLSLVLGSEITDASVAAISSSYPNLELLDLSGSSITDGGIGMICSVFPETLSKLLLALCPNITSSGIQFAAAQLPLLELMDCGMTLCDPDLPGLNSETGSEHELPKTPKSKVHLSYQKLFIKHGRMRKLSLWGCSGLDSLYLNCPELKDLNLNSCSNLQPERLSLMCPNIENVHAVGCEDVLLETITNQVSTDSADLVNHFPRRRFADGSKRVRIPDQLGSPQWLELSSWSSDDNLAADRERAEKEKEIFYWFNVKLPSKDQDIERSFNSRDALL